jgi:hypothetical protein
MKIGAYNPRTGGLLSERISGINFGNVQKGKHSVMPVLIRPEIEDEDIIGLEMYLQNNGGFDQTEFGYFVYSDFVLVKSYAPEFTGDSGYYYISDHFVEVPIPPDVTGGVPLTIHGDTYADYVWLDVNPSSIETGGTTTINYRFIFEYS